MSFAVRFSLFAALAAAASTPALGASVVVPLGGHDTPGLVASERTGASTIFLGATDFAVAQPPFITPEIRAIDGTLPEAQIACLPPSAFWADSNDIYTVSGVSLGSTMTHPAEFAPKGFAGLLDASAPLPMDATNLLNVGTKVKYLSSRPNRTAAFTVSSHRTLSTSAGGAFGARSEWFSGSELKLSGALFVHEPASVEFVNRNIGSLASGF
jgi:hypothetical protein